MEAKWLHNTCCTGAPAVGGNQKMPQNPCGQCAVNFNGDTQRLLCWRASSWQNGYINPTFNGSAKRRELRMGVVTPFVPGTY